MALPISWHVSKVLQLTWKQLVWVLGEHSRGINIWKCPEMAACLRNSKEAVRNRVNKRWWGTEKMKAVLGPIGNSENSGFPSALSEISSELLWFHLCEASLKYHSFLSTATAWLSSHGLGWVRWISLPPCIFSSDFEVIWLLQQKGEGSDGAWGYSFFSDTLNTIRVQTFPKESPGCNPNWASAACEHQQAQ